jgi:hypothetical protein
MRSFKVKGGGEVPGGVVPGGVVLGLPRAKTINVWEAG